MNTSGYSRTPLAKKLGIKSKSRIALIGQPEYYFKLFSDLPEDIEIISDKRVLKDLIHYFTKSSSELKKDIQSLKQQLEQDGSLWISWPKKSSKIETDINENIIRDIALKNGLVDIKVCAVDEIWSGLKLVIPVKERQIISKQ